MEEGWALVQGVSDAFELEARELLAVGEDDNS